MLHTPSLFISLTCSHFIYIYASSLFYPLINLFIHLSIHYFTSNFADFCTDGRPEVVLSVVQEVQRRLRQPRLPRRLPGKPHNKENPIMTYTVCISDGQKY